MERDRTEKKMYKRTCDNLVISSFLQLVKMHNFIGEKKKKKDK